MNKKKVISKKKTTNKQKKLHNDLHPSVRGVQNTRVWWLHAESDEKKILHKPKHEHLLIIKLKNKVL